MDLAGDCFGAKGLLKEVNARFKDPVMNDGILGYPDMKRAFMSVRETKSRLYRL